MDERQEKADKVRELQGDGMNPEDQKEFDKIVKLDAHELDWNQKIFIAARRSYLNSDQTEKFQNEIDEVLEVNKNKDKVEGEENSAPVAPVMTKAELIEQAVALELGNEEDLKKLKNVELQKLIDDKKAADKEAENK